MRGKGLLIGVELVEDRQTKVPLPDPKVLGIVGHCIQNGIILGRNSNTVPGRCNVLLIAPPLIVTQSEADQIVDTIAAAMGKAIN